MSLSTVLVILRSRKDTIPSLTSDEGKMSVSVLVPKAPRFRPPFLSGRGGGRLLWTGATLFKSSPIGGVGVTVTTFCSVHLMRTRPTFYEKKPPDMFKTNKIIFRSYLDMSRFVFWLPGRNKNESLHKTDCRNVLSNLW